MTSRTARFARNVGSSLAGQVALALLSFAVTPYLVRGLGLEAYGIYVLLQSAASYLQLCAIGAGGATTKFVAELGAVDDNTGLVRTLERSAIIHVGGPLIGAAFLAVFARPIAVRVFHVPPDLLDAAVFVFRCAAAAAVFVSLSQLCTSVSAGLHRFDWQSIMTVALNGGLLMGAVAVVHRGLGVRGVGGWYAVWNTVICLVWLATVWLVLRGRPREGGEGVGYKRLVGYSVSLWGGSLAWVVTFQFDRLFLAHDASLAAVSLYAVPAGLLQRLQLIPMAISGVLMPMLSEIQTEGTDTLRRAYLKGIRLTLFCVLGPLVGLFCLIPQFLSLWLGGHFGDSSVWPARILVLAQVFLALNFVPNALAGGCGRPWYLSAVAWAQAWISLLLWWLLVPHYALIGVAVASLVAQILPAIGYLAAVNRNILQLSWRRFVEEGLYHPAAAAALLLIVVFPLHALASTWPRLIALSAFGGGLYLAAFWKLMEPTDRETVRSLVLSRLGRA